MEVKDAYGHDVQWICREKDREDFLQWMQSIAPRPPAEHREGEAAEVDPS